MNSINFNLTHMILNASLMIGFDGNPLAKTGIYESTLHQNRIQNILDNVVINLYRDTGKWAVYNFVYNNQAYTLQVRIENRKNRTVKLTWDHRDACDNLTPSDLWEGAYIPVTVTEVVLNRAEGPSHLCGTDHKFSTLAEADSVLMSWAWGMPADQMGYDKVDFTVYLSNGDTYEGRFDLKPSHRKSANIKAHMVSHLEWVAKNGDMIGAKYAEQAKAALPVYRSL